MRIIVNVAMTIDGKIATVTGDSKISSPIDLKRVHKLRAEMDAIIVGISTVIADDPLLTVRHVDGKNPARVIIDSNGSISLNSRIINTANNVKTMVAVSEKAEQKRITDLEKYNVEVIRCGKDRVDLKKLFHLLESRDMKNIMIEGGGEVIWSILKEKLATELNVTIAPLIVGGRNAKTMAEGEGFKKMAEAINLKLERVERYDDEVILYYTVL
jgi:2,5-diamino-6-(ribosylamino)-4(3H)-pyrimidinone 5'-phosphate reductase